MALLSSAHSPDQPSLHFVCRESRPGLSRFGQPLVAVLPVSALGPLQICFHPYTWGQQLEQSALQSRRQAGPTSVAQESAFVDPSALPEEVPENLQVSEQGIASAQAVAQVA